MTRLTLRLDFATTAQLGPGKVRLLEQIRDQGSISGAGRALGMSYRRAWLLVDDLNRSFRRPLVDTAHGGASGGGASLTKLGEEVVRRYREIEVQSRSAVAAHIAALERQLAKPYKTAEAELAEK